MLLKTRSDRQFPQPIQRHTKLTIERLSLNRKRADKVAVQPSIGSLQVHLSIKQIQAKHPFHSISISGLRYPTQICCGCLYIAIVIVRGTVTVWMKTVVGPVLVIPVNHITADKTQRCHQGTLLQLFRFNSRAQELAALFINSGLIRARLAIIV